MFGKWKKDIPSGYVLATKMLVERKLPVCYMYREEPDNSTDTGWRFFTGTETDEYVNIPENIGLYDIKTIVKIDPDIVPFLSRSFDCAFERSGKNEMFTEVKD